jgi:ATP-binding cassette, subfamily B, bacterial PglK
MRRLIRQLISLLTRRQRIQAMLLLGAMIVRAVVELVGVVSIVPFMSIVADPAVIQRNPYLRWLFETGGFTSEAAFLTFVGFAVIATLALSNTISAATTWTTRRFVAGVNHQLAVHLLRGYLGRPYGFFVQRNSASLHKNILGEVGTTVNGILMPALDMASQALVVVALLAMLMAVDPLLVLSIVTVLGGSYAFIYLVVQRGQARLGRLRKEANHTRFKISGEAFGGIKDVKVLQREDAFLAQFEPASLRFCYASANNAAVKQLPRYLLETVTFGALILLVLYYLQYGHGLAHILPMISLFAVTGYRMMPKLQSLYSEIITIRFNQAVLDELCADLALFREEPASRPTTAPSLTFREGIRLEKVSFHYPGAPAPALHDLSLTVGFNEMVGIVGSSGSGKTTLVDLLLGLYEPTSGEIWIDRRRLDPSAVPAWRRKIGYVPQHIFLTDDTVTRNIAFGVPPGEIDAGRVERAARIAHLHDFILSLPRGYSTTVGERGVRLSGGQRQRIGIARALYHDPSVLILDEATSSLDGATEDAVMEAIGELAGKKTVILIAHRLSTVQKCDRLFLIEHGRMLDEGTFEELLQRSVRFRAMAKLAPLERSA